MIQDLDKVDKFPYSPMEYLKRVLWALAKFSIWRLLWHRIPILRMLLLRIYGADIKLSGMSFGSVNILRPWDLKLGENVAIGPRVHIYNLNRIEIGDNSVISQDAYLCGGTHDYTKPTLPLKRMDIAVGSNVWICAGAFIGPGVKIGDGAVVGARAVVMKNVEAWTVVTGNPARTIKRRSIVED